MIDVRQTDIGDILGDMSNGPMVRGHTHKVEELLRRFASAGLSLETCAGPRYLGRSKATLRRYACRLSLKFSDYCPRHLKPKKAKAGKLAA